MFRVLYKRKFNKKKIKKKRLSPALGGLAEALRGDRAPIRVHLLDTS